MNEWDATVRKRFTIAHELGHYVLHLHQDPNGFPDDRVDYKRTLFDGRTHKPEEEANRYAAALLMPAPILGKILLRGDNNVHDLLGMFGVSEEALSIRLNKLRRRPELLYEIQ
nr:ImmA/IrrE family metallo-endopeptidase [Alicyclobacillus sendaiensis]